MARAQSLSNFAKGGGGGFLFKLRHDGTRFRHADHRYEAAPPLSPLVSLADRVAAAPPKPKNARSKRAADAREPVAVEKGAKTAIIVRSSSSSEKVKVALSEIVRPVEPFRPRARKSDGHANEPSSSQNQLKKPHSISFSKSNTIRPFEDSSSLAFWASKNDASLFLVGSHTKKRPHGLVWARCFAGEVMEMLEVGIEEVMAMSSFKVRSPPSFLSESFSEPTPGFRLICSHLRA